MKNKLVENSYSVKNKHDVKFIAMEATPNALSPREDEEMTSLLEFVDS